MAATLDLRSVSKRFGAMQALDQVSLEVQEQAFVSLVGPSGCGKSTLLRLAAGLIPATSGEILVRGRRVTGPVRDASMVFQQPVLLPWRNVLDNVLFVADVGGRARQVWRARALELLALAGLEGFEKHYPHQLSGGMQQRVAICRALLLQPALIFMDEPFGALDILTRERLGFELQRIWQALRSTVVFVTHGISEAVLLSDRVIVLTDRPGHVLRELTVDLPRPRTTETLRDPHFLACCAEIRECMEASRVR